jgi:hypothetical protein
MTFELQAPPARCDLDFLFRDTEHGCAGINTSSYTRNIVVLSPDSSRSPQNQSDSNPAT